MDRTVLAMTKHGASPSCIVPIKSLNPWFTLYTLCGLFIMCHASSREVELAKSEGELQADSDKVNPIDQGSNVSNEPLKQEDKSKRGHMISPYSST